ncbi:MAG: HAD-IIIA family hydrolase [Myxococcales bacterium]|nr:HAD-IIIA family hydrolase [Myxococcales bacterium]
MGTQEVVLVLGIPASGKSSLTEAQFAGHTRLNRDAEGGSLEALHGPLRAALSRGESVVLDNTYATRALRLPVIEIARSQGVRARCVWVDTSIEDAQVNATTRMVKRYGRLLDEPELKKVSKTDPGAFGPGVLFRYRKVFEAPDAAEGFDAVERVKFQRAAQGPEYQQKAVLLDFDGTLRKTLSGEHYPTDPDDIALLPGRRERLAALAAEGYRFFGVSNQSGISKGSLTREAAEACFERTLALLGQRFEVGYCPHNPAPISCWCRKPMPGLGVAFVERHHLKRSDTVMVGDMTTDQTFAKRLGVAYADAAHFFGPTG